MSRQRQSREAGGSALNGQHPSRKTRSQTWHIAPELHPTVAGVGKGGWGRNGRGGYGKENHGETIKNEMMGMIT